MFRSLINLTTKVYKPHYRHFETHQGYLNNGIRIAVEETTSPISCVSLFVQTGSRFETPENNGISHFIEHIACMGSESMEPPRIEDCLISIGGQLTAKTTREYQSFSAIAPSECTFELINILSHILTHLDLRCSVIEMEKANVLMDLQECECSPKRVVFDYLHQAAFQGTSLAQSVIGSVDNIKNFDEQSVNTFLKSQYGPKNLVLAISGRVSHTELFGHAQKRFTHIVSDCACTPNHYLSRYTGSSIVYRDDSMPFAHVAVALEVPGYEDPHFWPLYVANCILGEWDKSQGGGIDNSAYLAQAASSLLCECYEPFYFPYQDVGLWGVYYVSEMKTVGDILSNIQDRWLDLYLSITPSELERGINYAKYKLAKQVESSYNSSRSIGFQMLYTCSAISLSEMYEKLSLVTVDSIKQIGHKFIYDKCPVVAAMGPTECLPDYGRVRAEMYWLRY